MTAPDITQAPKIVVASTKQVVQEQSHDENGLEQQMDSTKKKRVAIVGAGPSGLAACKHALAKGFQPVVFEASDTVGGVWARTLASTKVQTPAAEFRFSDFPWPAGTAEFPSHDQVLAYLTAYATRFGVLEHVRLHSKVVGAEFAGASEKEVPAWERWSGNGEAFGDGSGEWHLTVQHDAESERIQVFVWGPHLLAP